MAESCIHIYDSRTKEQSKELRHCGSRRPKKFKTQKSSSLVPTCVFWDKDGILLIDYLEKGATITARCYVALPDKLKQKLSPNIEESFRKKKIVSSSQGGHCEPENWQIFTLKS
jgi:hypothetical protein